MRIYANGGGFALSRRSARSFALFRIKGEVEGAQGGETRAAKPGKNRQEGGTRRKAGQCAEGHRPGGAACRPVTGEGMRR